MNMNKHMEQIHALNLAFSATEQQLIDEIAALTKREQEVASQLLSLQQQTLLEKEELAHSQNERESSLRGQYAEREKTLVEELQSVEKELQGLRQTLAQFEEDQSAQGLQFQQELDNLLRLQIQREQEVSAQIVLLNQKASEERIELARSQIEQVRLQYAEQAAHEAALVQQLQSGQLELQRLQQDQIQREKIYTEQNRQAWQRLEDQLRNQVLREQQITVQLLAIREQAAEDAAEQVRSHLAQQRDLHEQHLAREDALRQQLQDRQQELHELNKDRVKRELEINAHLHEIQQKALQETATLFDEHQQQVSALQRQHAERENILVRQLQAAQDEIRALAQKLKQCDEEHRAHINESSQALERLVSQQARREQEVEAQLLDMHEQTQQAHDKHARLLEDCTDLQMRLQAEIQSGQMASKNLQELLAETQHTLAMTHASLTWRMTAPVRKLASLFGLNSQIHSSVSLHSSVPITCHAEALAGSEASTTVITQELIEPNMPIRDQATAKAMPTISTTLSELLSYHDQQFVYSAYRTILGREPDTEGLGYYLNRLRNGFEKTEILAQLKSSTEGKNQTNSLPGLDNIVLQYKQERYPLIGWVFKAFHRLKSSNSAEQEIRSIANRIFLMQQEFENRFNKLENQIALNTSQITTAIQSATYRQSLADNSIKNNSSNLSHVKNTKPVNGTVQPPLDATSLMINIKEEISRRGKTDK